MLKLENNGLQYKIISDNYILEVSKEKFNYYRNNKLVYIGNLIINLDTTKQNEICKVISLDAESNVNKITVKLQCESDLYDEKQIVFDCFNEYFAAYANIKTKDSHNITDISYFHGNQDKKPCDEYVSPRFDWNNGKVVKKSTEDDILSCQQWLSPPPFCFVYIKDNVYHAIGIMAEKGQNNYVSMKHIGKDDSFSIQMEGHQTVEDTYTTPKMVFSNCVDTWEQAVTEYKNVLINNNVLNVITEKVIPDWWKQPIFCGWGQMRYDYRYDHDNHENGNFINVTDYCTQSRYEGYLDCLEKNNINAGTIIIDMGWALNPALAQPDPHKWHDMRAFIDKQHQKRKHVLLWYTPVVTSGLPDEACLMLNGRAVAPDPTSDIYKNILKEQIRIMLSNDADCLNADGFKIDFTQNTPSEEGVFKDYINSFWGLINEDNEKHLYSHRKNRSELISVSKKNVWGVELLRLYIENLYVNMKKVKNDSVLITHTPNPYFADIVDILRLNDLDGESDNVLEIMSARAKIARIGCKHWLIDTDNDLMINKQRWRDYISLQPKLGIPDTYYATHIASSCEEFDKNDYDLLRNVFENYRKDNNI